MATVLGQPLGAAGGFASPHAGVVHFAFADRTVRAVNNTATLETMTQLYQTDDGVPAAGSY